MEVTDIKFRQVNTGGRLRAMVSITLDDMLAVHDIKIIAGNNRLFLAMPSKRMPDGQYRDIVHPIGSMMRDKLEKAVLDAYEEIQEEDRLPFEEE